MGFPERRRLDADTGAVRIWKVRAAESGGLGVSSDRDSKGRGLTHTQRHHLRPRPPGNPPQYFSTGAKQSPFSKPAACVCFVEAAPTSWRQEYRDMLAPPFHLISSPPLLFIHLASPQHQHQTTSPTQSTRHHITSAQFQVTSRST